MTLHMGAATNKKRQLLVGEYLDFIGPGVADQLTPPTWPPDVFALAASLLRRADAYARVVEAWPPNDRSQKEWCQGIVQVGQQWRRSAVNGSPLPTEVAGWWSIVLQHRNLPVERVRDCKELCEALLQLCSAADEASTGAGLPPAKQNNNDPFQEKAKRLLINAPQGRQISSLCESLDPSRVVVLPKVRVPQGGLTTRSLTHHLALWDVGEVEPFWHWWSFGEEYDTPVTKGEVEPVPSRQKPEIMKLLILPWPEEVAPSDFRPTKGGIQMPLGFGFFTGSSQRPPLPTRLSAILDASTRLAGHIDGIVFPELALRLNEARAISSKFKRLVIGGEGSPAPDDGNGFGTNSAVVAMPFGGDEVLLEETVLEERQQKHHRWKVDAGQLAQYGLTQSLHPGTNWWEDIDIPSRRLRFFSYSPSLTFCVLICEDLARQEPVSELVRCVGPNLLIALLMDGPQLAPRWPARYATVLADDPGCSVLTVTSAGMARRSWAAGKPPSSVVALWKDVRRQEEIELAPHSHGVVLTLEFQSRREFSADGRGFEKTAGFPTLKAVDQVYLT